MVCGLGEGQIQRGEGGEEQADMNGQLATQVQGDIWACAMTQVLPRALEQPRGSELMLMAPVITHARA